MTEIWLAVDADPIQPEDEQPDQVEWHWGDRSLAMAIDSIAAAADVPVRVVRVSDVQSPLPPHDNSVLVLPLSLSVPPAMVSAAMGTMLAACRDRDALRQHVRDRLDVAVGDGRQWLPVVVTGRGPLYGEAIAFDSETAAFTQPDHLSDAARQPVYRTALRLLQSLDAPPSVYLMQFDLDPRHRVVFDRLYPFPARPALASFDVQRPDLFTCYWRCTTGRKLRDLAII